MIERVIFSTKLLENGKPVLVEMIFLSVTMNTRILHGSQTLREFKSWTLRGCFLRVECGSVDCNGEVALTKTHISKTDVSKLH